LEVPLPLKSKDANKNHNFKEGNSRRKVAPIQHPCGLKAKVSKEKKKRIKKEKEFLKTGLPQPATAVATTGGFSPILKIWNSFVYLR
jgi:predicted PP-loop superfamily ATPase